MFATSRYAKVRWMYLREKVLVNEIARRTSLSRNTIRKWLKCVRPLRSTKLDPCVDEIRQALETDAHRSKRNRCALLRLFTDIKVKGMMAATRG